MSVGAFSLLLLAVTDAVAVVAVSYRETLVRQLLSFVFVGCCHLLLLLLELSFRVCARSLLFVILQYLELSSLWILLVASLKAWLIVLVGLSDSICSLLLLSVVFVCCLFLESL